MEAPERIPSPEVIDRFLDVADFDHNFELLQFDTTIPETGTDPIPSNAQFIGLPQFEDEIVGISDTPCSIKSFRTSDLRVPDLDFKEPTQDRDSNEEQELTELIGDPSDFITAATDKKEASKATVETVLESEIYEKIRLNTEKNQDADPELAPSREALRKKRWRETLSHERRENIKKREREQKRCRFQHLSEAGRSEHRRRDRLRKARERVLESPAQKAERLRRERLRKAAIRARRRKDPAVPADSAELVATPPALDFPIHASSAALNSDPLAEADIVLPDIANMTATIDAWENEIDLFTVDGDVIPDLFADMKCNLEDE